MLEVIGLCILVVQIVLLLFMWILYMKANSQLEMHQRLRDRVYEMQKDVDSVWKDTRDISRAAGLKYLPKEEGRWVKDET